MRVREVEGVTFSIVDPVGQGCGRSGVEKEVKVLWAVNVCGLQDRPPTLRVSDKTKLSIRSSS